MLRFLDLSVKTHIFVSARMAVEIIGLSMAQESLEELPMIGKGTQSILRYLSRSCNDEDSNFPDIAQQHRPSSLSPMRNRPLRPTCRKPLQYAKHYSTALLASGMLRLA